MRAVAACLAACMCAAVLAPVLSQGMILPFGSTKWRFYDTVGKEPSTTWKTSVNFDASSWKSGKTPIGAGRQSHPAASAA
jgi:hypothetical protein